MSTINFKGKSFVQNHHLAVKHHQLTPCSDLSLTDKVSLYDNLIIQGDNLLALKALLPLYTGKIGLAVIDPVYNTGNENWVYNDNVNSPMIQEWLGKVVDKEDLTRHDKWLCMMMPRLKLIYELLKEDGLVFISIDDNELYNLKLLMNEIFGEENFVANLPTIMNLKGNQDEFGFAGTHEYTLVYAKDKSLATINLFDVDEEDVENEWEIDCKGFWKKGANLKRTGTDAPRDKRPNGYYPLLLDNHGNLSTITEEEHLQIYNPKTKKANFEYVDYLKSKYESLGYRVILPITKGKEMSWRWGREKVEKESDDIIITESKDGISFNKKQRPELGDMPTKKPKSTFYKPEYSSGNGTSLLEVIFEGEKVFDNPKPLDLIKDFISLGSKKNDIILDAFAGSATTAHATLDLNFEQKDSNRKFILIESESYANEITAERVRKVIKGIPYIEQNERLKVGIDGTFSFFKVGEAIELEAILKGDTLPSYEEIAKYLFYTATGEDINLNIIDENKSFIGETKKYELYLLYKPDLDYLKSTSLNIEVANSLGEYRGKKRLVFAPMKYLDNEYLLEYNIEYCQLPFEIYRFKG